VVFTATGCFVPTLETLEAERPRACDEQNPCLTGYTCTGGLCRPGGMSSCPPGTTRACGVMMGECRPGLERCQDDGTAGPCEGAIGPADEVCDGKDNDCDGQTDEAVVTASCSVEVGVCAGRQRACVMGVPEAVCTAASFGPEYEATEATCDGKDNDCDGQTDEALGPQACPRSSGVCAGATRTCVGGALTACTEATYRANSVDYEELETRCDGKDNDCDGFTDSWPAVALADGGVSPQRAVAAVVMADGGTSARRDVLLLAEAGPRLVARTVSASGAVSMPRQPSTSVASSERAWAPALATAQGRTVEAWFEQQQGSLFRVAVALAGPSGEALVNGNPGILPLPSQGPGQKLVVGVGSGRLLVLWAEQDAAMPASPTSVFLASCPLRLDFICEVLRLGAGRNPALLVDGEAVIVVYETGGRLRLARYTAAASSMLVAGPATLFGGQGERDAALAGSAAALSIYSIVPGTPETLWRREGACAATGCDPGGFVATPSWVSFGGSASGLSVSSDGATRLLTWSEVRGGAPSAWGLFPSATPTPFEVASPGRRPAPVVAGTAGVSIFYDTEGASTGPANVVLERRFCAP
jgi:hypothetical protein